MNIDLSLAYDVHQDKGEKKELVKITMTFTNTSITFPHLYSAVHSPATRCTLYLNMVLYATYYYPMMCCYPMMSE